MFRKTLLGILAWTPIILVFMVASYLVANAGGLIGRVGTNLNDGEVKQMVVVLFGGATLIALMQIAFSIVFIIDATSNAKITGLPMALWAVGFIFMGELIFPVYWFLHVFQDPKPKVPPQPYPPYNYHQQPPPHHR